MAAKRQPRAQEALLTEDIIECARKHGCCRYSLAGRRLTANAVRRMIGGLLNNTCWPQVTGFAKCGALKADCKACDLREQCCPK